MLSSSDQVALYLSLLLSLLLLLCPKTSERGVIFPNRFRIYIIRDVCIAPDQFHVDFRNPVMLSSIESWYPHFQSRFQNLAKARQNQQKWLLSVRPAKTQIGLCIHPVLSIFAVRILRAHSENSDQGDLSSLATCHFVCVVVLRLRYFRFSVLIRNIDDYWTVVLLCL